MTLNLAKQTAYAALLNPVMALAKQTAYVVLLPAPATEQGEIDLSFAVEITVRPDSLTEFAAFNIAVALGISVSGQEDPSFTCLAPTPKTWDRPTITAKSWDCATVVPAEECDGTDDTNGDDLDTVLGDRLVTVDGYGLKLAS